MIKLNRTTEYGLMALRHMSQKAECDVTSAREIADSYGLPFEITAKTLQRLKDTGIVQSAQGAKGGYTLSRRLEDVNLSEFLNLMEGPQGLVACENTTASAAPCEYHTRCEIRSLMSGLNGKVSRFLKTINLAEITKHTSTGDHS